jgi:hypothetical protein
MSVEHLKCILAIPPHPVATGDDGAWKSIEADIGGILPSDYKNFIAAYGVGRIDGFLSVYSPFSKNRFLNLVSQSKAVFNSLRVFRAESGLRLPFPVYPEEDGVFPWGCTDNGDQLYWRFRRGKFEHPLVVAESRGPEWQEFNVSMTDFLANVLARRITCGVFPEGFPSDHPAFAVEE